VPVADIYTFLRSLIALLRTLLVFRFRRKPYEIIAFCVWKLVGNFSLPEIDQIRLLFRQTSTKQKSTATTSTTKDFFLLFTFPFKNKFSLVVMMSAVYLWKPLQLPRYQLIVPRVDCAFFVCISDI
jgi:hypothetical protein